MVRAARKGGKPSRRGRWERGGRTMSGGRGHQGETVTVIDFCLACGGQWYFMTYLLSCETWSCCGSPRGEGLAESFKEQTPTITLRLNSGGIRSFSKGGGYVVVYLRYGGMSTVSLFPSGGGGTLRFSFSTQPKKLSTSTCLTGSAVSGALFS